MDLDEVCSHFANVHGSGNQRTARCPAHEDQRNSLSISLGNNGNIVLNCHAGCATESILKNAGLTMADLFNEPPKTGYLPKKQVAIYHYKDRHGNRSEKVRYSDKSFIWRREDGRGGYTYGRKGTEPSLYMTGWGDLLEPIYLVEGEKDAFNGMAAGMYCVSPPDGAGSKWYPQYTEALEGKVVLIIQDNDAPGKEFARRAAKELTGHAKTVKIIDLCDIWPELPEHGDLSDLLQHMAGVM